MLCLALRLGLMYFRDGLDGDGAKTFVYMDRISFSG